MERETQMRDTTTTDAGVRPGPRIEVTTHDGYCSVMEDAGEARAMAMALAREAGRAEVRRFGHPELDHLGVDCTPSFLIGTAVGVGLGAARVVRWQAPVADLSAAAALAATLELTDLCRLRAVLDDRIRALLDSPQDVAVASAAVAAALRGRRVA